MALPIPRPHIVARVNRIIAPFKSEVVIKDLPKGQQYQIAQIKMSPEVYRRENRIPHLANAETGEILATGKPGQDHMDLVKEYSGTTPYDPGAIKKKLPSGDKLAFIEESPVDISYRFATANKEQKAIAEKMYESSLIKSLQEKFPDQPVISLGAEVYATGLEGRVAGIVSQFEHPEKTDVDRVKGILGKFEKTKPINPNRLYNPNDLYKWDEAGTRIKKTPEEFVEQIMEDYHVDPEYGQDLYNFLEIQEGHEEAEKMGIVFAAPEELLKGVTEMPPYQKGVYTLKGLTLGLAPTAKITTTPFESQLIDELVAIGGYMGVSQTLRVLNRGNKLYNSIKTKPVTEASLNKQIKETGLNPEELTREQKIDFEHTHNYTPDPDVELQFQNVEKVTKMKQLEGLTEPEMGQVVSHRYEAQNIKARKMRGLETAEQTLKRQLPPESPATQAAREAQDFEAANKNYDELINDAAESGYLTTWEKMSGSFRKLATTSIVAIKQAGDAGRELATKIMNFVDEPERIVGSIATSAKKKEWHKLSEKEKANVVDWMDEKWYFEDTFKFISPRAKAMAEYMSKAKADATDALRNVGGEVATITRPFWGHHLIDAEKFFKNAPEVAKTLIKNKQAKDMNAALNIIDDYRLKYSNREFAGAEKARTLHIRGYDQLKKHGFDVDFTEFENYLMGTYRRAEELKQFGEKGTKVAYHLIREIGKTDRARANIAAGLFKRITHRDVKDVNTAFVVSKLTNFTASTMLGMSQIAQYMSTPNVFLKAGFKAGVSSVYTGLKHIVSKAPQEYAEQVGVLMGNTFNDFRNLYKTGAYSQNYMKLSGLNWADNHTRIMAANGGKIYINDVIKKFLKNPTSKDLSKRLEELYFDPKEVLRNKGLRPEQHDLAVKRFTDLVIGRTRPVDLPLAWSNHLAKFITLFKNFAFTQSRFMKNALWDQMARGNVKPLLTALTLQLGTTELVQDLKSKMTGKERPKGLQRIVDNLIMVQTFGLYGDIVMSTFKRGGKGVVNYMEGANISMLKRYGDFMSSSVKAVLDGRLSPKEQRKMLKSISYFTLRAIPYGIGQRLYNEMFPEEQKQKAGTRIYG